MIVSELVVGQILEDEATTNNVVILGKSLHPLHPDLMLIISAILPPNYNVMTPNNDFYVTFDALAHTQEITQRPRGHASKTLLHQLLEGHVWRPSEA